MKNKLKHFPYQNVLVLGLAKSGTATACVLSQQGLNVYANDLKTADDDAAVVRLRQQGVTIVVGEHDTRLLENVDCVIKNPGIPYSNVMIEKAEQLGMPILTEIECLQYMLDENILGITGSNGKTTTTTLSHLMLKNSEQNVAVAGNIGEVAIEIAADLAENATLVLELSSFQLMGTETFKPKVAALLNLSEAHLDYHGSYESYKLAKAKLFTNQTAEDYLVYNLDDQDVVELVNTSKATLVPFSTTQICETGAYLKDDWVYFKTTPVIAVEHIRLVGEHNLANILASVAATLLLGATLAGIKQTLTTFDGVKHRLQFVGEKQGRLFYNDSKATNILATTKALQAFKQPTRLIAGGLDRGNGFEDLLPYLTRVVGLYLYGETKDKLKATGENAGIPVITTGETLDEMIKAAWCDSQAGDVILLSPACASWDQFATFEKRGDLFISTVKQL